jgi:hypothetical protein
MYILGFWAVRWFVVRGVRIYDDGIGRPSNNRRLQAINYTGTAIDREQRSRYRFQAVICDLN